MMISRTELDQDEQLVNLFRNRAQLKKVYLELQDQCASLKDQLRNSQASTRRAEERLEAIERLMARPEAGFSGLVYFQLRSPVAHVQRTAQEIQPGAAATAG